MSLTPPAVLAVNQVQFDILVTGSGSDCHKKTHSPVNKFSRHESNVNYPLLSL